MWSQEQVAVDSHVERLVRVRQMVQEEVRGSQPQVTDRDVQGAIALFSNLARRVAVVPSGAPLPTAIRSQRWSPLMVPLLWSAAGEDQSVPIVEWLVTAASAIGEPVLGRSRIRREFLRPARAIGVSPRPKFERALPQCRTLALMDRRSTPLKLQVPNETEVGLVGSARLVQLHVLPEGVARKMKKRSIASRAATLQAQHHVLLQDGSPSSIVPLWPSDEPVPVQVRSGVSEFFQATTQFFFNCELVGHVG